MITTKIPLNAVRTQYIFFVIANSRSIEYKFVYIQNGTFIYCTYTEFEDGFCAAVS